MLIELNILLLTNFNCKFRLLSLSSCSDITMVDLKDNLTIQDELHVCVLVFPLSSSHTHTNISISRFVFFSALRSGYLSEERGQPLSICMCVCYQFLSVRWIIPKSHFPPDTRQLWVCRFALMLVEIEVTCFCHRTITIQFSWIIAL